MFPTVTMDTVDFIASHPPEPVMNRPHYTTRIVRNQCCHDREPASGAAKKRRRQHWVAGACIRDRASTQSHEALLASANGPGPARTWAPRVSALCFKHSC